MSPTFAACTFGLHRTGITHTGLCAIENNLLCLASSCKGKDLPLRANIMVLLSIILEEIGWIILGALAKIGGRKVSLDTAFFQTNDVGHSAIPRVTHRKLWINLPSKADPIE